MLKYYVNRVIINVVINLRGLYVHIPFCKKICTYCDFCKRVAKDEQMIWDYLYALNKEYQLLTGFFDTIYIGGGTPSMLNLEQLKYLLTIFKNQKPTEYTIEINPESYTTEKGKLLKEYGVNRASIGIQTFNEAILEDINRIHKNKQTFFTIDDLNNIGITNISVDLIFSLPNQSLDDVIDDLNEIKKLKIKHISYYSLILEENTILYDQYKKGLYKPTSIDLESEMFEIIIKKLESFGFKQYEVSNFTKGENYESLHNKLYWTLMPYEAIGAGSHGFNGDIRYYHSRNITNYTKHPIICIETQSNYELYQDYLIFGLRMNKGIDLNDILKRFNRNPLEDFPKLKLFIKENLLEYKESNLKFTKKGLFLLNKIVEEFI